MVYYIKIYKSNNCKVTCLMTLFLFSSVNIINATYDKKRKKREKATVSVTYAGALLFSAIN